MRLVENPGWKARRASQSDARGILALFERSIQDGMASKDDAAGDLHDVMGFYETGEGLGRFWVVEDAEHGIVGMIGVIPEQEHVARMRRLHVHPSMRMKGIGSCLVSQALQHCHDNGFVKIHLETDEFQKAAIALFTRFGFRHQRTKEGDNRNIMEFYIDLYSSTPDREG
ncbi:MAG: GNAT family N-acetyltransferase [Phycisphaerales bacterium JB043]